MGAGTRTIFPLLYYHGAGQRSIAACWVIGDAPGAAGPEACLADCSIMPLTEEPLFLTSNAVVPTTEQLCIRRALATHVEDRTQRRSEAMEPKASLSLGVRL